MGICLILLADTIQAKFTQAQLLLLTLFLVKIQSFFVDFWIDVQIVYYLYVFL